MHPGSNTTYTLTATNPAGSITATTDVNVTTLMQLPVIQYFMVNPSTILKGSSSTLSWQTSGASQVLLNGSVVAIDGHMVISPALSQTYTLTAINGFGNSSKTITLTVLMLEANPTKQLQAIPQL